MKEVELIYVFLRNDLSCWKVRLLTNNPDLNVMEMRLNLLNQFNLR